MSFVIIPDAYVILASKGVTRQAKAYERNGRIYAQFGGGFIGLNDRNGTSVTNVRWEDIVTPGVEQKKTAVGFIVNAATFKEKNNGR